MTKKILSVILAVIAAISCFSTATVFGQVVDNEIQPRMTYINSANPSFTIKGVKAYAAAAMTAKKSTSLKIEMQLQKKSGDSYSPDTTWTATGSGTSLSISKDKTINPLSSWRLMVRFEAGNETMTKFLY